MYAFIDPSVDRYKILDEEHQNKFKKSLTAFVRLYAFLSQILPFQDVELEKLYSFGRFLLNKLPKIDYTERLKLDNEVALEYYRLQKIGDGDLVLQVQGEYGL
ncbi:MAG: type I restriction endonuclease subunit R, partial [Ignavibacteriae bacterium]|nr:type I restriction endonuclease subunit R [Ignavibacteriota bacterium]